MNESFKVITIWTKKEIWYLWVNKKDAGCPGEWLGIENRILHEDFSTTRRSKEFKEGYHCGVEGCRLKYESSFWRLGEIEINHETQRERDSNMTTKVTISRIGVSLDILERGWKDVVPQLKALQVLDAVTGSESFLQFPR